MEGRKTNSWQPFIYAVLLGLGIIGGYFLQNKSVAGGFSLSGNNKIDQVLSLINNSYVDTVNDKKITEAAIEEMLRNLDPHSTYIPAAELEAVNEQLDGNFEGIGVEFNIFNDTILIVSVIPGGPSEKLGILPGDRIIKVEGQNVAGVKIENEDVIKKLKGKKDSKVNVTIKRTGIDEELNYTIVRDKIPIYSVEAAYMTDGTTGYIKLVRFSRDTYEELVQAMAKLKKEGMQNLVLDLRGNPGGYLHAATQVSSEFLGPDKMIVYTEGRSQPRKEYKTESNGSFTKGKLVVLIDENSASASEIVSGAVQDWDRGIIVGRRSYGKGLVQESFRLRDGSAIRLTIARYYTPTGRSIQKPYDEGYKSYEEEIAHRYSGGELDNPDSVKKNKSLEYKTPAGRKVYGGGGIYPDVFVPIDTAIHTELVSQVYRNGIISQFAYRYVDNNRASLKAYKNAVDFASRFTITDAMLADMKALLAKSNVAVDEKEFFIAKDLLSSQAKALIARQTFGKEAYYVVLNSNDKTFKAAMNALADYDGILKGSSKLVSKY